MAAQPYTPNYTSLRDESLRRLAELTKSSRRSLPGLHLFDHLGFVAAASSEAGAAGAWVRRITRAQQSALRPEPAYRELRIEDGSAAPKLVAAVTGLLLGDGAQRREGFPPRDVPGRAGPWTEIARWTAGSLGI